MPLGMNARNTIDSERLVLRPHRLDDYEAMCAMYGDPDFFRLSGLSGQSREEVWHRLLRYMGHWTAFGWGLFAVTEKATGAFVGDVGLADFHRGLGPEFDLSPEAAWAITPKHQGKGYALEAVYTAHRWFDTTHPQRTVCIIAPVNLPSKKVAARLGYRPFGEAVYKGHMVTTYERSPASPL